MTKSNSALENFVNSKSAMLGGGYTTDVSDPIGKGSYSAVAGYDDVAIHNNARPGSCAGSTKLVGGAKKSKKYSKSKKSKSRKMKKVSKTKKQMSKKHNMSKKLSKSKRRSQRGGNCGMNTKSSDNYPFTGELSDHSPDTATKNYGARQPSWGPNAR